MNLAQLMVEKKTAGLMIILAGFCLLLLASCAVEKESRIAEEIVSPEVEEVNQGMEDLDELDGLLEEDVGLNELEAVELG